MAVTGAPCAGKSATINALYEWAWSAGISCIQVEEAASKVLGDLGGFDEAWVGTDKIAVLQTSILSAQLAYEDAAVERAALLGSPVLVLCDCGALSGAAYCSPTEWRTVMAVSYFKINLFIILLTHLYHFILKYNIYNFVCKLLTF